MFHTSTTCLHSTRKPIGNQIKRSNVRGLAVTKQVDASAANGILVFLLGTCRWTPQSSRLTVGLEISLSLLLFEEISTRDYRLVNYRAQRWEKENNIELVDECREKNGRTEWHACVTGLRVNVTCNGLPEERSRSDWRRRRTSGSATHRVEQFDQWGGRDVRETRRSDPVPLVHVIRDTYEYFQFSVRMSYSQIWTQVQYTVCT